MNVGDEPETPGPLIPNYAGPAAKRALADLPYLTIAAWCGAIPLTLGTAVFALWLVTRYDALQAVGLFIIFGGLLLFLVGAMCLVVATGQSVPKGQRSGRRWKQAGAGLLLLANFPAAALIVMAASDIESRITVTVQNVGTSTIDSFLVTGPGITKDIGPIPAGASRRVHFHATTDGQVTFTMRQGQNTSAGVLIGYVTPGMASRCDVVVNGQTVTLR